MSRERVSKEWKWVREHSYSAAVKGKRLDWRAMYRLMTMAQPAEPWDRVALLAMTRSAP